MNDDFAGSKNALLDELFLPPTVDQQQVQRELEMWNNLEFNALPATASAVYQFESKEQINNWSAATENISLPSSVTAYNLSSMMGYKPPLAGIDNQSLGDYPGFSSITQKPLTGKQIDSAFLSQSCATIDTSGIPSAPILTEDEKRRRNSLASARFRQRKKEKEMQLEKEVLTLRTKCSALERLAAEQARQIQMLKSLLIEKSGLNRT